MLAVIALLAALLCFILACLEVSVGFSLVALGLAFLALYFLLGAAAPFIPTARKPE